MIVGHDLQQVAVVAGEDISLLVMGGGHPGVHDAIHVVVALHQHPVAVAIEGADVAGVDRPGGALVVVPGDGAVPRHGHCILDARWREPCTGREKHASGSDWARHPRTRLSTRYVLARDRRGQSSGHLQRHRRPAQ